LYVKKNQSLSRLIGPPSDALSSYVWASPSGSGMNRFTCSDRLSLASGPLAPWMNNAPENRFPPSRGMMFARRPPCATSALSAPVSYEIS
jgi:hypothetical protein